MALAGTAVHRDHSGMGSCSTPRNSGRWSGTRSGTSCPHAVYRTMPLFLIQLAAIA
jgi:hypothetical protein